MNALSVIQGNKLQLTELEALIMAESAQEEAAYDPIPTRIKISPGGVNVFATNDGDTFKVLKGIIAISQKARAYWPEKGTGSPPMCASPDGSRGIISGEVTDAHYRAAITAKEPHPVIKLLDADRGIPPFFDCATCPMAQWGSIHQGGAKGKGQACKSLRRLVVFEDGKAQPALFTLPPTSILNFDAYASALARNRSAYWAVRTKITLEAQKSNNNEPYSIAAFATDEALSKDELFAMLEVRKQFDSLVRSMPIDGNEYDVVDSEDALTVESGNSDQEPPF